MRGAPQQVKRLEGIHRILQTLDVTGPLTGKELQARTGMKRSFYTRLADCQDKEWVAVKGERSAGRPVNVYSITRQGRSLLVRVPGGGSGLTIRQTPKPYARGNLIQQDVDFHPNGPARVHDYTLKPVKGGRRPDLYERVFDAQRVAGWGICPGCKTQITLLKGESQCPKCGRETTPQTLSPLDGHWIPINRVAARTE